MQQRGRPPAKSAEAWASRIIGLAMEAQSILMELNSEIETALNTRALKNKRPRKLEVA